MRLKFISIAVACLVIAPALPAQAKRVVKVRKLAKGVIYREIRDNNPRLRIHTATVKRAQVWRIRAALGNGELPGWERTSSIARRRKAVVAINGDYGRRSGRPVMAFAQRGVLRQTPLIWGRNFATSTSEDRSYIGHPKVRIKLRSNLGELAVGRLNNGGPYGRQAAMFDAAGGWLERPPKRACSARLMPVGLPRTDGSDGSLIARHRVDRVNCRKARLYPKGGRIVSARWRTGKSDSISQLKRGMTVSMSWSFGWGPIRESVGGNPTLMEEGKIMVGKSSDPFFAHHPRTGVGVTKTGKVIFVTVDGRQRRSTGMTLVQFARFFRSLGAHSALNLDGGGSTTMVVRGRVVNRPSDRSERPVSSALVVVSRKRSGSQHGRSVAPEQVWPEVASDPASTGGLALELQEEGAKLPPDLAGAARTVARTALSE